MMRVICQLKFLTIIVLSFFVLSSKGQVYQSMPQYGYSGPRFNMDSTLSIPTVCGVPTLKSNLTKKAAIAFDSCNGVFYQYNPKTLAWSQITGGGGNAVDTIYKNTSKDSIVYTINGKRYAIKDSIGGGGSMVSASAFGSFYDSTTQTIASTTIAYPIKLTKIDTAKGFRLVNNKIIADSTGLYNMQWSGQFQNTDNAEQDVSVWIKKNGVNVIGSTGFIAVPKTRASLYGHTIASWNYIIPMIAGDSIVWYWQANNTGVSLQYYPQQTSPTRPSTASVIVTITPVSGGGGGGSGTPAGNNGYVQFNNSGSFGADSSLFWNNTNKRLGIGTTQPRTKLDVALGKLGNMPYNYEIAAFEKNGDVKFGVYNADNYNGSGSSIILGNTKNVNANGNYPGFEFQNVNDSENINNSYVRYNYAERATDGNSVAANINLLNIYANGTVQLNPFSFGLSVTPRLIVGDDNTGANFEVSGNAYIGSGLYSGGNLTSAQGLYTQSSIHKHIIFTNDTDANPYYATDQDNIIMYTTDLDNSIIYLPDAPEEGQEIIIKHIGINAELYQLYVDGNGHYIQYGEGGTMTITISDVAPHCTTLIYGTENNVGGWYVLSVN
jgi:hypothetical protein